MSKTAIAKTATATTHPDRLAPVTEVELAALKRDRAVLETLKAQAAALSKNLDAREEHLIARIEAGAEVLGDLKPAVKLASRRNVSWLTSFVALAKRLGLDETAEVAQVKSDAPVTFYKELAIP